MKLLKLHIENFRSLRDVTWEPGDLNVLIGPNAGGKSNLLKAIDLLAAAADGRLRDHVTKQGGIGSLVWNGTSENIGFDVQVTHSEPRNTEVQYGRSSYELSLKRTEKSTAYTIDEEFLNCDSPEKNDFFPHAYIDRRHMDGWAGWVFDDINSRQHSFSPDAINAGETLLSLAAHPMLGARLVSQVGRYFSGWSAYQAFRTDREASVRWAETSRRETVVGANGANLVSVLHTLYSDNSAFESDINDAMFAAFGDEFVKLVFSPDAADQRIQFKVRWKSLDNPVPASDLSDGTLRYLYLLAILANPNPPPLIAIDEPETGLHPRMLSYIAEFAAEAARRTQVVFTTHSAEFLDALTPFNPTTTIVESQNSETKVQNVAKETLDHWLKGYTLGELFRSNGLEAMT